VKEVLKRLDAHEVIEVQVVVRSESVSSLAQKRRKVECPRCKRTMSEVVSIAPLYDQPGLVAYECDDCHYVTSEIVPAENGRGPRPPLDILALATSRRCLPFALGTARVSQASERS
jgi:hypothetical protein